MRTILELRVFCLAFVILLISPILKCSADWNYVNSIDLLAEINQDNLAMQRCNENVALTDSTKRSNVTFAIYNVWNFDDGANWRSIRLQQVISILRAANPDVIALNEIRYNQIQGSMFADVCSALSEFQGYYQPAMLYSDGTVEGVALFTKLQVHGIRAKHLHLSGTVIEDINKRVILGAWLSGAYPSTSVFVSHFSYQDALRLGNAVGASYFMSGFRSKRKVFLADTNAISELDPAVKYLELHQVLLDPLQNADAPTYCNCGHSPCYLNERPDRILVSPSLAKSANGMTGPIGSNTTCPSDHRAVFLQILQFSS